MMTILMAKVLEDEQEYLRGNRTAPQTTSVLEPDTISPTTMTLTIVWLICACFGIFNSLLLVYGLYSDNRLLLVPWIFTVFTTLAVDLIHIIYMFVVGTISFEPLKAMIFTMDFFLLSVNLYALLCVVSQYQEYKAGRGRRENYGQRVPAVKYTPHTTATTCLSTKGATTYQDSRASTTHSPTAPNSTLLGEDSIISTKLAFTKTVLRKHVKFPDELSITVIKNQEFSDGSSEGQVKSFGAKEDISESLEEETVRMLEQMQNI